MPWNEPYEIMKALDAGAYGVIVPMVNNRAEAEQAVAACRYPPDGNRSFGPIRAALYGGRGYAKEANGEIACIAMIETAEGIEKVEEIVTTPGLDGVYIGPSDLALSLGLTPRGDNDDPVHAATVERIQDACRRHGVAIGIHTGGLEFTRRYLDLGFNFVTLGSDLGFMVRTAAGDLAAVRGTMQEQREENGLLGVAMRRRSQNERRRFADRVGVNVRFIQRRAVLPQPLPPLPFQLLAGGL